MRLPRVVALGALAGFAFLAGCGGREEPQTAPAADPPVVPAKQSAPVAGPTPREAPQESAAKPAESPEPVDSIRWEIVRKGMEDYEYLYLLREVSQGGGPGAEEAKGLLEVFETSLVPGFEEHTRDAGALERLRRQAGKVIGEAGRGA